MSGTARRAKQLMQGCAWDTFGDGCSKEARVPKDAFDDSLVAKHVEVQLVHQNSRMSWRQLMLMRDARMLALGAGGCYRAMGFAQRLSSGSPLLFRPQSCRTCSAGIRLRARSVDPACAQRVTDCGQSGLPDDLVCGAGGAPPKLRQFWGLRRGQQGFVYAATIGRRPAGYGNTARAAPSCFAGTVSNVAGQPSALSDLLSKGRAGSGSQALQLQLRESKGKEREKER